MHFEWLAPTMSGLAHESQCLKGVGKSAAVVDGEEVWKISGAGLSEPVINSPLARLVGRVKIAEVEAPPKKKPCEALAPRDVWLFSMSLIVFIYMNISTLHLLSSSLIFLIYSSFKYFSL